MSFITRAYSATKLLMKANAPTIMVVGGVVAMGAGTVVACKKTLDLEKAMVPHAEELDRIDRARGQGAKSFDEDKALAARFKVYTHVGVDMAKIYAVSGILFGGGAALVLGGHRIMLQRNATLAIAFTGLKEAFDVYRSRVVHAQGHEADQFYMSGSVIREIIDPETGEVAMVESRDWTDTQDPYNRVFERGATTQFVDDLGVNKMFVSQQQRMANILLGQRGHLYLSEVYESLGFPETDISRVVGWKVRHLADGSKDIPFVDFGLDKPMHDDWKYSRENGIYLDFNCQGLIVGGKVQKILERS